MNNAAASVLNRTTAVIVTFNISKRFLEYFRKYQDFFNEIVIIDNGSEDDTPEIIMELMKPSGKVRTILLPKNVGLAAAQNIGIKIVLQENTSSFVFLLDHDSYPSKSGLDLICEFADQTRLDENVGVIGMVPVEEQMPERPNFVPDIIAGKTYPYNNTAKEAVTVISSGSLIGTRLFKKYGLFDEALFIDDVDHDFTLRLHVAGVKNYIVDDALLYHNLGDKIKISLLGWHRVVSTHSPFRLYYISRNATWMWIRYFHRMPLYTIKDFFRITRGLCVAVVFGGPDRLEILRAILNGLSHGLTKYPGRGQLGST